MACFDMRLFADAYRAQVHVAELEQSEVDADAPPELQQLCEVFPDHEREQLVAVLEASNWNVEEATQVLLGGGGVDSPSGTPQQQRWTKLNVRDVFGKGLCSGVECSTDAALMMIVWRRQWWWARRPNGTAPTHQLWAIATQSGRRCASRHRSRRRRRRPRRRPSTPLTRPTVARPLRRKTATPLRRPWWCRPVRIAMRWRCRACIWWSAKRFSVVRSSVVFRIADWRCSGCNWPSSRTRRATSTPRARSPRWRSARSAFRICESARCGAAHAGSRLTGCARQVDESRRQQDARGGSSRLHGGAGAGHLVADAPCDARGRDCSRTFAESRVSRAKPRVLTRVSCAAYHGSRQAFGRRHRTHQAGIGGAHADACHGGAVPYHSRAGLLNRYKAQMKRFHCCC